MTTVFTIGHSNHEPDAFLELLRENGIGAIADVRSSPYSRYVPQANRETLARDLRAAGVAYHWFGDRLGGKPDGVVADYDQLRSTTGFQQGIEDLLTLAEKARTGMMCSEGDHRECHRHKLITPALLDRNVDVYHIQPDGNLIHENKEPRQLSLF